jgi:hypothetical protein
VHKDRHYEATEYVAGKTLREELDDSIDAGWRRKVELFAQAGRGLAFAHRAGVAHGAFSADEVHLTEEGRVLVGGFHHATTSPSVEPPEVARGEQIDHRSDQFAFCAALWEAIQDEDPFVGDSGSYLERVDKGPVRNPLAGPTWVYDILLRGLSSDPNDRFESMDALLSALEPEPETYGPGQRIWAIFLAGVMPVLSLLPIAAWWWNGRSPEFSHFDLAVVDGIAMAALLGLGWMYWSRIERTITSRVLFMLLAAGLGFSLLLVVGMAMAGMPPRHTELLHLFVWFATCSTIALIYEPRMWFGAVVFGVAYLASCAVPGLVYAALPAATLIVTQTALFAIHATDAAVAGPKPQSPKWDPYMAPTAQTITLRLMHVRPELSATWSEAERRL